MKLIIHDLTTEKFAEIFPEYQANEETRIISDNGKIKHCTGCFGCWVKTPGKCVLKDGYENMGALLAHAKEVIIISRSSYGSYSPFVKNILDRSISYVLPFFTIRNNEVHHALRYETPFKLSVSFYGDGMAEQERALLEKMVQANSLNFHPESCTVNFVELAEAKGAV